MFLMIIYAIIIFVAFAVIGGAAVLWIIRNQPDDEDQRTRGIPRDHE